MRALFIASSLIVLSLAAPPTVHTEEPESKIPPDLLKNEAAREKRQKVDDIFAAMAIQPGSWVADLGAGEGFFTVRIARRVGPEGRVFAVDIRERPLEIIRERATKDELENIRTVLAEHPYNPQLPPRTFDAVLVSHAYHEFEDYRAILGVLALALKPGGRLVILDRIEEHPEPATSRAEQTVQHQIHPDFVAQELEGAGFQVQELRESFTRTINRQWLLVASPRNGRD